MTQPEVRQALNPVMVVITGVVAAGITYYFARGRLRIEVPARGSPASNEGFITFDVPDEQKSAYRELLIAFEEFAELRGYEVAISIDISIPNRLGVKFTLRKNGPKASLKQVTEDFQAYINKIRDEQFLDILPPVLPPEQHHRIVLALKDRINLLQHSCKSLKDMNEFYKGFFKSLADSKLLLTQAQTLYIQTGTNSQVHSVNAIDSPQSVVGTGIRQVDNRRHQSIHIAGSFNEKRTQIEAVESLKKLLDAQPNFAEFATASKSVGKVCDELKDEPKPDPKRIHTWLETAKHSLKSLALTKEVIDAFGVVNKVFHLLS